ncbi:hypothetical protein MMN41_22400, partial [Escherichia coli]|nr:hypothetical protein [Escherichia coli]
RNRSHWSTSKTPSYTKSVSWQHHPYGTLLCVSDKPLHGEIKLPGQANRFYEGAISEHLQIGIRAIDLLRAEGDRLHSRKLRTFNEPPFR